MQHDTLCYGDKRTTTLDGFSQIFHTFIRFNIHILSDRNWTTPTHSHIITGFRQVYRSIPNDFRLIALGNLDRIRHTASPRTGTGETIGAIDRYQYRSESLTSGASNQSYRLSAECMPSRAEHSRPLTSRTGNILPTVDNVKNYQSRIVVLDTSQRVVVSLPFLLSKILHFSVHHSMRSILLTNLSMSLSYNFMTHI